MVPTIQDIVVRVCFILGNLTAEDAQMREQLFFSHTALPVINSLAAKYFSLEVLYDDVIMTSLFLMMQHLM